MPELKIKYVSNLGHGRQDGHISSPYLYPVHTLVSEKTAETICKDGAVR